MIKIGISTTILFLLFITVTGQTKDEELAGLRNLLRVPASTVLIAKPISPQLPSGKVVKVYIATEQDKKVNQRVIKWINKWNQEEGSKYGQLQVISSVSDADVILAIRRVREWVPQTRTVLGVGSVFDPSRGISKSRDPKIRTNTYFPTAHYTYLITRSSDTDQLDALQILYGKVDRSYIQDYTDPDKYLFNELKERMKKR